MARRGAVKLSALLVSLLCPRPNFEREPGEGGGGVHSPVSSSTPDLLVTVTSPGPTHETIVESQSCGC